MHSIQEIPTISLKPASGPQSPVTAAEDGFASMLDGMVSRVNKQQVNADQAMAQLSSGNAKNIHDVMIAMEQADISLRMLVQVRNKAMDAYQEIMRLQV